MINLFSTQITNLSLHKIGNKFREEPIFLSDKPYKLSDEIAPLLKEFFLNNLLKNLKLYSIISINSTLKSNLIK